MSTRWSIWSSSRPSSPPSGAPRHPESGRCSSRSSRRPSHHSWRVRGAKVRGSGPRRNVPSAGSAPATRATRSRSRAFATLWIWTPALSPARSGAPGGSGEGAGEAGAGSPPTRGPARRSPPRALDRAASPAEAGALGALIAPSLRSSARFDVGDREQHGEAWQSKDRVGGIDGAGVEDDLAGRGDLDRAGPGHPGETARGAPEGNPTVHEDDPGEAGLSDDRQITLDEKIPRTDEAHGVARRDPARSRRRASSDATGE